MNQELCDNADKLVKFVMHRGVKYCDVRAEDQLTESISIENNQIENTKLNSDGGFGVRFLKNGKWGFCSFSNLESFEFMKDSLEQAINHTSQYSENKKSLSELFPCETKKFSKEFKVLKKPNLEKLIEIGLECDEIIFQEPLVKRSSIISWYTAKSKFFTSSEGTQISQSYTDVVMELNVIAHNSGVTQSINVTEGGRGGMEKITESEKVQKSAREISQKASELLDARHVKEENSTVVMNPDFVSLLTHEILGHPSEADRVLGKEMAWAGGAWWKNKLGEKIGSKDLNVFDDPTIEGSLGWYFYDDEGVKSSRTSLVEDGILKNHMHNRETAMIFGVNPTGNMRATDYRFMPLIRMACTCISPGDWNPDEIIKETKNGYLISNMKIPSIDMRRYNWSISCQYAQKIENGELTDLLRDVIVMGVAPDFFQSIDACGNDFAVRPITNCGKGDPMQSMMMGNGGPTLRGLATIKSVN